MTTHLYIEERSPIEATFIKYNNNEDLFCSELKEEKLKNEKLQLELETANRNLQITQENLEGVKKLIHKLEQDTAFYKIQVINLKNVNIRFIRTINNLQSYRYYVADLLAKRFRTNQKVQRLVKEIKHLQQIIKSKNSIIYRKNRAHDLAFREAAKLIKESYSKF